MEKSVPQVKIVFFDIDNTLYDPNKKVPESTVEALQALKEKGIATAIATGRSPFMFQELREKLGIDSYVSFNGSYVVYKKEPIYKKHLPKDVLERLEQEARARDQRLVFLNERTMRSDGEINAKVKEGINSLKLPYPLPEIEPDFYCKEDVYQSLLFYGEQDDHAYLNEAPLDSFDYVRWHPYAVDVIPKNGSKAFGISQMLQILQLSREETAAFGDGYNDVEMLRFVGTGVAMGNAVAAAKKAADEVTRPVDQDGIYYGLKKIGLI
ncbi:Cof-type HAD-IIB family hydrolase [Sporolactobacillus spathodeae]|uniref:Cof subfamily protein (Haloacid dehalogenase superfamily) n=1 Tax=Sporolactobacillus spathodeae TaxID=1465502 RepID=A0ABS2Q6C9_9BACL|nr:Cof subfamily protein (haloacid dehalogenase superfamily) [Sporolactobacillus spathodeae]